MSRCTFVMASLTCASGTGNTLAITALVPASRNARASPDSQAESTTISGGFSMRAMSYP